MNYYLEENQYLRDYLTEALDKNAELKTCVMRMEKIMANSEGKKVDFGRQHKVQNDDYSHG